MYVIAMMLNNQLVEYVLFSDTGKGAMEWKYACTVLLVWFLDFQYNLSMNHSHHLEITVSEPEETNICPWAEFEYWCIELAYCIKKILEQITNAPPFP